jgi:hypothetical protein
MEYPMLNVGAVGFSAAQRTALSAILLAQQSQNRDSKSGAGHCAWQLTDYREANALVLNLARSEEGPDKILRFYSDPAHPNPIGVVVSELTVPFAIAHKSAVGPGEKLTPATHFVDLENYGSVVAVLEHLETQLGALRNIFAFAQHITQRRSDLDIRKAYHLVRRTGVVALIDLSQHTVWLRDGVTPVDLDNCIWQTQPPDNNTPGDGFTPWTLEEVFWIFAQYSRQNKLPQRYLEHAIYFRRRLRVRASLVQPRQLVLLEHLSRKPLRYGDFQEIPGIQMHRLMHDLYAFYMCRAITTDPRKVHTDILSAEHSSHVFGPSAQATGADALSPVLDPKTTGVPTASADLV